MTDYTATVAETARGPIEYAVVGTGAPVLVLHGSPGGIDAARPHGPVPPRTGFRRSPRLAAGLHGHPAPGDPPSIDAEADLLVALLDELGIDRVGVHCWSAGAPPATGSPSATPSG